MDKRVNLGIWIQEEDGVRRWCGGNIPTDSYEMILSALSPLISDKQDFIRILIDKQA